MTNYTYTYPHRTLQGARDAFCDAVDRLNDGDHLVGDHLIDAIAENVKAFEARRPGPEVLDEDWLQMLEDAAESVVSNHERYQLGDVEIYEWYNAAAFKHAGHGVHGLMLVLDKALTTIAGSLTDTPEETN